MSQNGNCFYIDKRFNCNKIAKFFCKTCNYDICDYCLNSAHEKHILLNYINQSEQKSLILTKITKSNNEKSTELELLLLNL